LEERLCRGLGGVALLKKTQKQNLVSHFNEQSKSVCKTSPTGTGATGSPWNRKKPDQQREPTSTKPESLTHPASREKRRLRGLLAEGKIQRIGKGTKADLFLYFEKRGEK